MTASRKSIALALAGEHFGGAEKFISHAALFLAERGHGVALLAAQPSVVERALGTVPAKIALEQIRLDRFDEDHDKFNAAREWCRANRPDAVLFAQTCTMPFREAVLGARAAGVPNVVLSLHYIAHPVDLHGAALPLAYGNYWPERPYWKRWLYRGLHVLGVRRDKSNYWPWKLCKAAHRTIVTCQSSVEWLTSQLDCPREKIRVIGRGVDPEAMDFNPERRADWRRKNGFTDEPVVASTGRLCAEKGYRYLVEAMTLLGDTEPGIHLVIAGEGPEREMLAQIASNAGMGERLHLPGWTAEVHDLLCGCDIFVCSSIYESFSNSTVEAMACRRPCVGTRVGALPDFLGDSGIIVPTGDARALAEAIGRYARSEELRERMGRAARKVVEEKLNEQMVFSALEEVLTGNPQ